MKNLVDLIKLKADMNKYGDFLQSYAAKKSMSKFNKNFEKVLNHCKKLESKGKGISERKFDKIQNKVQIEILSNNYKILEVLNKNLAVSVEYNEKLKAKGLSLNKLNKLKAESKSGKRYDIAFLQANRKYADLIKFDCNDYFRAPNIKYQDGKQLFDYLKDYVGLINSYKQSNTLMGLTKEMDESIAFAKGALKNLSYLSKEVEGFTKVKDLKDMFIGLEGLKVSLKNGNEEVDITLLILENDKNRFSNNEEYFDYLDNHKNITDDEREKIIKSVNIVRDRFVGYPWWQSSNAELKYFMQKRSCVQRVWN